MIARRPRAPALRRIASCATARSALLGERELHPLELEQLLVLLDQRVLRLGQDGDEILLGEIVEGREHRQAADELRDHPELGQSAGSISASIWPSRGCPSSRPWRRTRALAADAPPDVLLEPGERAAADEEDVVVSTWMYSCWLYFLPPRGVTFARVPSMILRSACWTPSPPTSRVGLGPRPCARPCRSRRCRRCPARAARRRSRRRGEVLHDVLDVLADVAGLGEAGGVGDGEGDVQEAGERLRESVLPLPVGPISRMFDFCISTSVSLWARALRRPLLLVDALVVVVDGDGEDLLGAVLADHVVVEEGLDLRGRRQRDRRLRLLALALLGDDVVAELDALVADVDGGPPISFAPRAGPCRRTSTTGSRDGGCPSGSTSHLPSSEQSTHRAGPAATDSGRPRGDLFPDSDHTEGQRRTPGISRWTEARALWPRTSHRSESGAP